MIDFQVLMNYRMSLNDVINNFTSLDILHFVNTSIFSPKKRWQESVFHGEWDAEDGTNGGSDWNSRTFLSNPQVRFSCV
jgi:calpain-5